MPNGAIGNVIKTNDIFTVNDSVFLEVDKSFRDGSSKSHTAAHIVHASLRKILGEQVSQAGSNVEPGRLRFDFSYSKKVSEDDLNQIFDLSNSIIFTNTSVNVNIMHIDKAKEEGALAFFGDKYGDEVRVVDIGEHSKELCGGTHVNNSTSIGLVVLTNESSIGSNLRRVEMLSGFNAYEFLYKAKHSYAEVANILGVQEEKVLDKLENTLNSFEELSNKIKTGRKDIILETIKGLESKSNKIGKYNSIVEVADFNTNDEAKTIINSILNNTDTSLIIILNKIDSKTLIVGGTNEKIDIDISKYVSEASMKLSGGASKDPNYSVGGGPTNYDTKLLAKEIFTSLSNDLN